MSADDPRATGPADAADAHAADAHAADHRAAGPPSAGVARWARALWTVAPGVAELRDEALPPRAADQALVRSRASGLSRGTERLVLQGRVPPSQYPVMRAPLMAGEFPFPVKYGYCAMGVVEAGPEPLLGRRVFVLPPHQDLFLAPAAMCIPIPDAVPDHRASHMMLSAVSMFAASTARWSGTASGTGMHIAAGARNRSWCGCRTKTRRRSKGSGPASATPMAQ